MRLTLKSSLLFLLPAAFLLFYFVFDPMESAWLPQCVFHKFTGLQCMGCGSQRVVHSLLHGDISGAFRANALLVLGLPYLIFLGWLELSRMRHPRLYSRFHSPAAIILIAVILFLWFILRNMLGL